jgi:tRNA threonylcarbamoyladenosine modification (KEOPS) complex Cgi121 subunit
MRQQMLDFVRRLAGTTQLRESLDQMSVAVAGTKQLRESLDQI